MLEQFSEGDPHEGEIRLSALGGEWVTITSDAARYMAETLVKMADGADNLAAWVAGLAG